MGLVLALSVPPLPVAALDEPTVVEENITSTAIVAVNDAQDDGDIQPVAQDVAETMTPSEDTPVDSGAASATAAEGQEPIAVEAEIVDELYPGVIVTQIQTTGGSGRADEDLIEVYNNSAHDIDITGWTVVYQSATGSAKRIMTLVPSEATLGWRLILPARVGYLFGTNELVARFETSSFAVDQLFSSGMTNGAGSVVIADNLGVYQSGVAWGDTAPDGWIEGAPAVMSSSGGMIERKVREDGYYQQTRNNEADFKDTGSSALSDNYQIGQAVEVFDSCLNMTDIQATIPDGYYRNEQTGACSDTPPPVLNSCEGLIVTEVGAGLDEQFIELYNPTDMSLTLNGCTLMTNRTNATFVLTSGKLASRAYAVVSIDETDLTLSKTTNGTVYLLSEDMNTEVDVIDYMAPDEETSWALIDGEWLQTYTVTAGAANSYAKYPPCDVGYYRNTDTGRCNKIAVEPELAPCDEGEYRNPVTNRCRKIGSGDTTLKPCAAGQYRNPETNRCKSIASATSSLVPCDEGEYRNPATNRCKKIATTASTLKPCDEGYVRNPETNRCRKVATTLATMPVADFPVEEIRDTSSAFVAWWALGGVLLFGVAYATWEWRHEITRVLQSVSMRIARRE